MLKRDLIKALEPLGDEDEVIVAIITPPDDEGFEENDGTDESDESPSDDSDDEDDEDEDDVDTITQDIDNVDVRLNEVGEDGKTRNFAALIVDMTGDDEDEDEDEDEEDSTENS